VPSGTPNRLATVIPTIMIETASVRFPASATRSATIDPTPKKAPCGRPDTKRIAISIQ